MAENLRSQENLDVFKMIKTREYFLYSACEYQIKSSQSMILNIILVI